MVKQSRVHVLLIASLAAMVVGHLGMAFYKSWSQASTGTHRVEINLPDQEIRCLEKSDQGSSAKAFGISAPKARYISCKSVKELDRLYLRCGFDLKKTKAEGKVPRIYLSKLPQDMCKKRKTGNSTFIQALLPHILQVNEKILEDRKRLLALQKRQEAGGHLRQSEKKWLCSLAKQYRCKSTKINSLLIHVDIVPPSLALAQAMIETGGGRSSAALKKNSTFGHMQTKTSVARFESLLANVEAYITNLNRHAAYKSFRALRASMRSENKKLCSVNLANGLLSYSIRKAAYVREVQKMIHSHKLTGYDHAKLEKYPES